LKVSAPGTDSASLTFGVAEPDTGILRLRSCAA
jgi:hypothetical protein